MFKRSRILSAVIAFVAVNKPKYVARAGVLLLVKPLAAWRYLKPLTFSSLSLAALTAAPVKPSSSLSPKELTQILKTADDLFDRNDLVEVLKVLRPYKESGHDEVLWRISRAAYLLSKSENISKEDHAALVTEAYAMVEQTLELNENSAPGHKWMGVVMDAFYALQGFRVRCQAVKGIRQHFERALEINPKDATAVYMLGHWFYVIADLPWYQRSILQAIGGKEIKATFDEALAVFKKAEEVSPNFYSLNLLMLGKTLLKMGDKDAALVYLHRVINHPHSTDDDHQAHQEALELLKSLEGK